MTQPERNLRTTHLVRRAPSPQAGRARPVRMGGRWLQPQEAAFLTEYLKHYNGQRAVRASHPGINGGAGPAAWSLLRNPNVRSALREIMEERQAKVEVTTEQVARYWYDIATADPRELSQHIRVPCRFCYGIDHQYQFTDGELRSSIQQHLANQLKLDENQRTPFDELGGSGYTRNRYPMRGPDWMARMERMYAEIRRPIPEGVEVNSDHSCPECHGDGERHVWFADTRHLSRDAARLYNGVRLTRDAIEIKTLDRISAMEKFEVLVGMVRPRRPLRDFNMDDLSNDELDAMLDEARSRGLLSEDEISQGKLIDATPVNRLTEKVEEK